MQMYVVTPLHVHLILSSDLHDHVHRRQAHRHAALPCDEERERHRRVEVRAANTAERVDHAHERGGNGQPTSRDATAMNSVPIHARGAGATPPVEKQIMCENRVGSAVLRISRGNCSSRGVLRRTRCCSDILTSEYRLQSRLRTGRGHARDVQEDLCGLQF